MKICSKCDKEKDTNDFHKYNSRPDGLQRYCKDCIDKYRRARYCPEKMRKRHLLLKYGLTLEDYDRILEEQGGCGICGTTDPRSRSNRFHVDHDHRTGKIRELLCNACNVILGNANDNTDVLKKAIAYIEKHRKESNG